MTDQPSSDQAPSRSTFSTTDSVLRRDFTAADCREPAIGHLKRALEADRGNLWAALDAEYVRRDPALSPLRADPRFQELRLEFKGAS